MQNQIPRTSGFIAVALTLILTPYAWSQEESLRGTVVVAVVSRNKVAIAADSRGTEERGRYMDADCKISTLDNKVVFASAGFRRGTFTSHGKRLGTYDSHDLAQRAFSLIFSGGAPVTKESINAIASKWTDFAVDFFSRLIADEAGPADATKLLSKVAEGGTKIGDGFFAGVSQDGQITVVYARVSIEQMNPGIKPTISSEVKVIDQGDPLRWLTIGEPSVAQSFLLQTSPQIKAIVSPWKFSIANKSIEDQTSLWATQLVRWTIQYGPKDVGGPIDLITLDHSGINWVDRKPTCKASE